MNQFDYTIKVNYIGSDRRFKGSDAFPYMIEINGLGGYTRVLAAYEVQYFCHTNFGFAVDLDMYLSMVHSDYKESADNLLQNPKLFEQYPTADLDNVEWAYSTAGYNKYFKPRIYLKKQEHMTLFSLKFSDKIVANNG